MVALSSLVLSLACSSSPSGSDPSHGSTTELPDPSATTEVPPLEQEGRVVPGPDEDGWDDGLARWIEGHDRVFGALSAQPDGLAVTASLVDPAVVEAWVEQGTGSTADDLAAFAGVPASSLVSGWHDLSEQALFGGIGSLGNTFRYAVLLDDPAAPAAELDAARAAVERDLETLHQLHVVTGRPGTIARGLGRLEWAGLEEVETVPLFDDGEPQPRDKEPVWRADQSGTLPGWMWIDDAGKDQWAGYVLALGAAWQVAASDPAFDADLLRAVEDDASVLGAALMAPSPHTGVDLTLIDADGRHVTHEDLNAAQADGFDLGRVGNPFNALLALALVRTLAEVSGDAQLDAFFDELVDRGYADELVELGSAVYYGYDTDYREVGVAYAALLSWLLHERDPIHQEVARIGLTRMWGATTDRATADHLGSFATVVTAGWIPVDDGELAAALADLEGTGPAPLLDREVENCDDGELDAGHCVAVDGATPIELYGYWDGGTFVPELAYGDVVVALEALPSDLRPPEPFAWIADPYRVNGGGSDRLLSAADLRAAYWLGRALPRAR